MTAAQQDMSGRAITVKGVIDPDKLGVSIMHEHLFLSVAWQEMPPYSAPATDVAFWEEKLTLDNLQLVREGKSNRDNKLMADLNLAISEALEFRNVGGNTIVDVTNFGLGRDPLSLVKVANATGLNIVMGSGYYSKEFMPADMDQRSVEQLTEEIVRDITIGAPVTPVSWRKFSADELDTLGVGNTGIRSGIIGEVGINGDPITPNEVKSLQASARASRATGAAITLHRGGRGREKLKVASILAEEGADLSRVIFGHADADAADIPLLRDLLDLGVYIQFDLLGRVGAPIALRPPVPIPNFVTQTVAADAIVADVIPQLIEAGFGDRILLSQDVCSKVQWKAYGGTGYSFVLEKFIPHLLTHGVAQEQVDKIMVENPRRVLTFVKPG